MIGEVIELEDRKDYMIVDIINLNDIKYLLLKNVDSDDICFRKQIIEEGKEFICMLNEDEFNTITKEISK